MKIKKKCLLWESGFVRFRNDFEINWSFYDWALPLNITFSEYLVFVRFFAVSFIFPRKVELPEMTDEEFDDFMYEDNE